MRPTSLEDHAMRTKRLTWAVLFTMAWGVSVHATQCRPGTMVSGVAVDQTGAVLPGAHVQLKAADATSVESADADEIGRAHV